MKKRETFVSLQTIFDFPKFEGSFKENPREDMISFRRKRVNELRCLGYTNKEIKQKIGVSLSTIEKDFSEIKKLEIKWFEEESIKDFCSSLHDSIILCDKAIEDLQILYKENDEIDTKLKIMSKISEFEERKTSLYSRTMAVEKFIQRNIK